MEKLQVDNALLKQFKLWFQDGALPQLQAQLQTMYPQDIAAVIDRLNTTEARQVMNALDKEAVVKVLVETEQDVREQFLSAYTSYEIANEFIENMNSDDAAYILNHFPNHKKEEIISNLQDIEYASSLLELISYETETAGSLMALELVKAYQDWSVAKCIEEIRIQAENVES
ncbi:MAG: hypothetical protein Q8R57_01735, partial [Bacteroidota bacterium]|nr:hypothetical protein [Bacteroidota bacterium]